MPDRDPHLPGAPSQPNVPATVGGLVWAYHRVQQGGTRAASRLQQTPPVPQPTTPGSALRELAPAWPPEPTDTPPRSSVLEPESSSLPPEGSLRMAVVCALASAAAG